MAVTTLGYITPVTAELGTREMPTEDPETPRIARACINCNKKKIRCKFENNPSTCDSCANLGIDCIARARKKRKLASRQESPAAGADSRLEFGQPLPHYWGSGPAAWPGDSEGRALPQPPPLRFGDHTSWSNPGNNISPQGKQQREHAVTARFAAPTLEPGATPNSYQDGTPAYLRPDGPQRYEGLENKDSAATPKHIFLNAPNDLPELPSGKKSGYDELSDTSLKTLELHGSLELPFRAARQSLIDTYMQKCYPWTPMLDPQELDSSRERPSSLLLSQSIFLAASRVSSAAGAAAYASSEQFYQRAKVLFWTEHERDPYTVIKSTLNLHWYNSSGVERLSYNNSTFWLQIAVGLAHQIGLHREPAQGYGHHNRRLWWSLVTRDCQIAVGYGRPRSINFEDSDIRPPCSDDFPGETAEGELFISFVEISIILADLAESLPREHVSQNKQLQIERALFRWSKTLAPQLRLSLKGEGSDRYMLARYDVKARQLHIPYFINMVILGRSTIAKGTISSMSILAASFVAGIFEDFLARDELLSLDPIFIFYLLAAGVSLASLRRCQNLWRAAEQDLEIIQNSLKELSKRWPSAASALNALQNDTSLTQKIPGNTITPPPSIPKLEMDQKLLFEGYCTDLCRMWLPYMAEAVRIPIQSIEMDENPEIITAEILGSLRYPAASRPSGVIAPMVPYNDSYRNVNNNPRHDFPGIGVGEWLIKYWDTGPSTLR
ncbi:hypothetical protein O988_06511 [Pseudogymnoascus sp. VKM F-3808]|nr:hypothetical protein O988_06511 [Pseudogymnoascus sp. VKM F-3808]